MDRKQIRRYGAEIRLAARRLKDNPITRYPSGPPLTNEEIRVLDTVSQPLRGLPYSARRRILAAAFHQLDGLFMGGWVEDNGELSPDTLYYEEHGYWPGEEDDDP